MPEDDVIRRFLQESGGSHDPNVNRVQGPSWEWPARESSSPLTEMRETVLSCRRTGKRFAPVHFPSSKRLKVWWDGKGLEMKYINISVNKDAYATKKKQGVPKQARLN